MPKRFIKPKNCADCQLLYALPISVSTCRAFIVFRKHPSSSTTPMRSLTARSSFSLSSPSTRISPASRWIRCRIDLMVVVLPAPFSPIKPITAPRGRVKLTFSSAKPSYCLHNPLISSAFSIIFPPQTAFSQCREIRFRPDCPDGRRAPRPSGAPPPRAAAPRAAARRPPGRQSCRGRSA